MSESETVACYCGAVKVTVKGEPKTQLFCHCDDCRRWCGGVALPAKLWAKDDVEIEGELVTKGQVKGNTCRKSCVKCGSVICDQKDGMGMMSARAEILIRARCTHARARHPPLQT